VTIDLTTTTVLTPSSLTLNAGQTVQLTATVTSGSGTPSGNVTFLDGTTTLNTITLNGNGTATYNTTLAAGSHSLTASYTPSGNDVSSTSAPVTVQVQDFSVTASPASLTIAPGGSGSSALTFTGLGGLAGTVTYTCSDLPTYISCNSGTVTLSGSIASTATVNLTVAATLAAIPAIWLLLAPIFALAGFRRKRGRRRAGLTALASVALLGCGGTTASISSGGSQTPPAGQQTATITATTSTIAGTLSHTVTIVVNVQ